MRGKPFYQKIFSKLIRLAVNSLLLFIFLFQQAYIGFSILEAKAESPAPSEVGFNAVIKQKDDNLANGRSKIKFAVQKTTSQELGDQKFTAFIFFGDNFYREYISFTGKYADFKEIEHEYTKPGSYKPLLIVYSADLKKITFKFLDPILVEQKNIYKPIAQGSEVQRLHDAIANTVTIKFSGQGSYDTQTNNNTGLIYYWNFGDGTSANTESPEINHTYMSAGTFFPSLTVKTQDGRESDKYELASIKIDEDTIIDYNKRSFASDIIPIIISKINQAPLLNAKITYGFRTDNSSLKLSTKKFTVFVFFGDNFYKSYEVFTDKFSSFPTITHIYNKVGTYKPLVIAYSSDFQNRLFKFLEPIEVTKIGQDAALPIAQARLVERIDDRSANIVTVNLSSEGSFDPINNSDIDLTYLWDFGDGNKLQTSNQSTSHVYNSPGTFIPTLIVKTEDGRISSKYNLEPIVISKQIVCLESRDSWTNIGVCQADCGGISGEQLQTNLCDEKRYIKCTSNQCRSNSFSILNEYIEAKQFLSLDADTSGFEEKNQIAFRYIIDSSSEEPREQIYKQSKFYLNKAEAHTVTLEIYEDSFKASTYTKTIEVAEANKPPIAQASADKYIGEASLELNFDASASFDPENSALNYQWNFGDQEQATGLKTSHIFSNPGVYIVNLTVTDNRGLSSTFKLNNVVVEEKNYPPKAKFIENVFDCKVDDHGQIVLEQKLNNQFFCSVELDGLFSSDPNGNINTYNWSIAFQNPITNNSENLTLNQANSPKFIYKFDKFGSYDIQLKVTDSKGLSSTYSSKLKILEPLPILKAEVKNRLDNLQESSSTITFSANESIYYQNKLDLNPGIEVLDYIWDFGDGSNGQGLELEHQYLKAGVYSPILKVSKKADSNKTILAEKSLESIVVTGEIPVVGSLSFSNLQVIENDENSISAVTIGAVKRDQYKWIYHAFEKDAIDKTILTDKSKEFNENYGEVLSSILDAPQSFTEAGQYQLVHQLDDKPILSETLTVLPNQIPIPNLQVTQNSNSVTVSAEGSYDPKNYEINSYEWDFGDGTIKTGISESHIYSNSGIYYIKLTVVDSKGQIANAFSKAIVVGDFADQLTEIPSYVKVPDKENGEETISSEFRSLLKLQTTEDPVSDFDTVANRPNNDSGTLIQGLTLPNEGSCTSGTSGSCQCRSAYASNISISNIIFNSPNQSRSQDKGASTIEILGNNFCQSQLEVKVSVDGGALEDRSSAFINNSKIVTKLKAKDFKGSNLKIKVQQKASNNNTYYSAEKTFTTPTLNPAQKTYQVLDGNSVRIDYNIPNIFIESSEGYGNAYHIFKDGLPVAYDNDAMIISKNIRLETDSANQAKLKIDLNGNRFEGIRVWVNGNLVLSKDPAAGNKFYDLVSDTFSIGTGPLDLQIKIIAPSANGVQVKAVTIYTAPRKPMINNLKLNLLGDNAKNKSVQISMDTTPNTRLQAVHINRKTTEGLNSGKYKILQAQTSSGTSSGKVNLIFNAVNFMPGTHCVYFYLTNGSHSDEEMETYIKNNLVKPFNQALGQNKFAFINQSQFDYLKTKALPIKHGICFNEDHQVNLQISSPATPIITQQNNQSYSIQLSSDAPNDQIRNGWEYEMKIFDGANEESSTKLIDVPINKVSKEKISFTMNPSYLGVHNMVIRTRYYDPTTYLTYVGEVSTQLNVVSDKNPVAKVTTENIKKLILEPSDNPNERASFFGYNSYDPNKAAFGAHINDGIGSYSWLTQYKELEAAPEAIFNDISSNYDSHANIYYVGPRKEPGIYRAQLTVKDFYNNSDTAFSDSVQVIRPGQSLVASLSVNNSNKIFEPDLNGKHEVSFNARVKVITAKNNPPTALKYKFIYDDGTTENGSINVANIQINKYIDLKALTERKHIYSKGEFNPQLEVNASFTDGHLETWTVSAGTVTIAKLPTHVAFTPIIANLGPKDIPNPGFEAKLKVISKTKYGTNVEAFGWDFGDTSSWTYSGIHPDTDFMKATVTDTKHTYNDAGTYQIKFWVKTIDKPDPIIFALKPLVIQDIPAPVISSLTVNKQAENIKVTDEEIISIEVEITTNTSLQRMEVVVHDKGTNEIVYSKTFTDNVPTKFIESFNDLYLSPGNYILDILVFDSLEQRGAKTLEFAVEKTTKANQSADLSGLEEFYNEENFTSNLIHKIPIDVDKFLKVINIYNNGKKIKSFEGVLPDQDRLTVDYAINADGAGRFFDEPHEGEIYTPLHEGENNIKVEVILPNGKVITSKPYLMTLDSTSPVIEIQSPLDISIHARDTLTLAGKIFDENLAKLFYRINSNKFKTLDFKEVEEELDLYEFEKDIDLNSENIQDSNFIEIKAVDKGGNIWYANTSFIVSDELVHKIRNNPNRLLFSSSSGELDDGRYDLSDEEHRAGDAVCEEIRRQYLDGHFMNMNRTFTNVKGKEGGVFSIGFDGYYIVKQGKEFDVNFKLQVCDMNRGEAQTSTRFSLLNPNLIDPQNVSHPLPPYNNQRLNNIFYDGNYQYKFNRNIAGLSEPPETYLEYFGMNTKSGYYTEEKDSEGVSHSVWHPTYFEFNQGDSISNNWHFGKYLFHSSILFESGHQNIHGTYSDADEKVGVNIVSTAPGESIQIVNVTRVPQVLYLGHDIDKVEITAEAALLTDDANIRRFRFFIDGAKTMRITNKKNSLTISPPTRVGDHVDPYDRYLYLVKLTAYNIPQLTGKEHIDQYQYLIQLLNEAGNSVAAESRQTINILPAPEKYIYLKVEELFPETYTDKQRLEEKGFVSNNPKQFKLTVYHINDNGLTLQEKLDSFDPAVSPLLSRLKIRKISLDNLDQFADVEKIPEAEKAQWNGNQMNFRLMQDSVHIHPDNKGSGLFTNKELEEYKDYWKTEYISYGPDDGKTLIKDAGKLEFDLHMEDWFEQQKAAGYGYGIHPEQFDTKLYDLDPYPIDLKNIELAADNLFFQPNLERILAEPEKLYLEAEKVKLLADLSYEDEITDRYRLPKFEYKPRKETTNEEKKKIKAGFLINNRESKEAFFELSPFSSTNDINLDREGSDNYTLDLSVSLLLNNDINALLKKDEMVNLEKSKTLYIPISIITKSDKDLDIELRGTFTQEAFPVSILDLPKFELIQGQKAKKLSPEELEQESVKMTLDSKDNLLLHAKYSNIVGKGNNKSKNLGFDPLELEVQLYDSSGLTLGKPFFLNKATMLGKRLSEIDSKSYATDESGFSIYKTINMNLSKYIPDETKEFIEETDFVRVKLKRDFEYLESVIPAGENIYEYYDINDNDPYRSKYLKIKTGRKNSCNFSITGAGGRYRTLSAFNENRINGDLLVNFTSASRKKAKIWVTYASQQSTSETNVTFADAPYSSINLVDPENPEGVVEVDPLNNRVDINEGIFNFKNIDLPKDTKRYTLLFKVAESSASENSVAWNGLDAEDAAVCSVEIIKGIEDAQVFIDRLEPIIVNQIPIDRDYEVQVRTNPAESIEGVNLYLQDLNSNEKVFLDKSRAVPNGAYITINLRTIGVKDLNKPYRLIAELTYNTTNNEHKTEEKNHRDFMFVKDTEPIITFGSNGVNDLGDSGSGKNGNEPNVIYAKAEEDYNFKREITFSNLKYEDKDKITFQLIEMATNTPAANAIEISSITPSSNPDEFIYNIKTQIPFQTIEDIKEYTLEAYFDNQRLSQSKNFLIVDDPELKLTYDNFLAFGNGELTSFHSKAKLENAFARDMHVEYTTFIDGDPSKGPDTNEPHKSEPMITNNLEIMQPFKREVETENNNFSLTEAAIPLARAAGFLIGDYTVHGGNIEKTYTYTALTAASKAIVKAVSSILESVKIAYGTKTPYFDFELFKNDNSLSKHGIYFDGPGTYKLKIFSTVSGTLSIYKDDSLTPFATVELSGDTFDYFYPKKGSTLPSRSVMVPINPPSTIPGTGTGVGLIRVVIKNTETETEEESEIKVIASSSEKEDKTPCIVEEVKKQSGKSEAEAGILINEFISQAEEISNNSGVISIYMGTFSQPIYYSITPGNLRTEDYPRITIKIGPETQPINREALGYCRSLANHIVHQNDRPGLFRVFESPNHLNSNLADSSKPETNYKVYWLSIGHEKTYGIKHILYEHGSDSYTDPMKKGKFNAGENIVDLLKRGILSSENTDRSPSIAPSWTGTRTVFDRKAFGNWTLNTPKRTVLRIVGDSDTESDRNTIRTAFPFK